VEKTNHINNNNSNTVVKESVTVEKGGLFHGPKVVEEKVVVQKN
jgi:hypothetical protein